MKLDIYEAIKTFPSGSHNAPYTPELGSHWPQGQQFTRKPENMQKYMRKKYGLDRTFFNQIGGEEVCVSFKTVELADYLRPLPRIEHTEAGPQTVIADTPARLIPTAGLKPKRAQNQSPLALEMPEIDARQGKLF
jgi:hypothetical protein